LAVALLVALCRRSPERNVFYLGGNLGSMLGAALVAVGVVPLLDDDPAASSPAEGRRRAAGRRRRRTGGRGTRTPRRRRSGSPALAFVVVSLAGGGEKNGRYRVRGSGTPFQLATDKTSWSTVNGFDFCDGFKKP